MPNSPPEFPPLTQRIPIQPTSFGYTLGYAQRQPDGSGPFVMLTMSTPSGSQIYFFLADAIDPFIEALQQTQAMARRGLVVVPDLSGFTSQQ